ncbi:hypothetical protein TMU01_20690 [Tenuibacillus multivorans]|uniref:Uncharacterized protein n=2 Tax=Tenuibacillus multivorans TaxID=237069 RepID=A0A1H0AST6_9BACI|nr:hypothetical protein TMU01_20690 [Tenuibacillus multivorans]SDN36572.1 hypothetical protein SAMN05216498_2062 [Tenuibacillus multivorans]
MNLPEQNTLSEGKTMKKVKIPSLNLRNLIMQKEKVAQMELSIFYNALGNLTTSERVTLLNLLRYSDQQYRSDTLQNRSVQSLLEKGSVVQIKTIDDGKIQVLILPKAPYMMRKLLKDHLIQNSSTDIKIPYKYKTNQHT